VTLRGTATTGCVARIEEIDSVWENVVGKSEGIIPKVKPKCAWEDNIKMYLMKWRERVYLVYTSLNVAISCSACMASNAGWFND
jgi:hypothetical protein